MGIQRYNQEGTVTVTERSDLTFGREIRSVRHMKEANDGEWVRWKDHQRVVEELEARIPDLRIERLEKQLKAVHNGCCPECGQYVRDWKSPSGSFAPEAWATLREANINPSTGHKKGCKLDK